jgi:hypothetical protein
MDIYLFCQALTRTLDNFEGAAEHNRLWTLPAPC